MNRFFLAFTSACLLIAAPAQSASRLVFMHENGTNKRILMTDENGKDLRALTDGRHWALYPDITADGQTLAYVEGDSEAETSIVLLGVDTGTRRVLTAGRKGMFLHPRFSGDGRYIAYAGPGVTDVRSTITVVEIATGSSLEVPATGVAYFPTLSSDGHLVYFQENLPSGLKRITRYDLTAKTASYPTVPAGVTMAPSISSDDEHLAYTAQVGGNWDVYMTNLLTNEIIRITDSPARDFAPTFRPDGGIVFASDRNGSFQLFSTTVSRNGAVIPTSLVTLPGDLYAPNFSADLNYQQGLLAPIPAPARSSFGTARVGQRIYVVGGHQGSEHTYPRESFLDRVDVYDLTTGKWHQAPPRPVAAHGLQLAAFGKYVYAFGGFAFSDAHQPGWKSIDLIDRFDTETETWEEMGHLPRPRSSNAVVVVGTRAYLIGGWDSTPKAPGDAEGTFHREIDVFDFITNRASDSGYKIPDPLRRAFTAVELNGKAILIGGIGVGSSHFDLLDQVTEWDPVTDIWRELPALPFTTFAPAAGVQDGSIYVFGGMFKLGEMDYDYVKHIFKLDPGAPSWTHTGRYLSENKGFSQVVALDQRLGILGGHSYDQEKDAPTPTFEWFSKR